MLDEGSLRALFESSARSYSGNISLIQCSWDNIAKSYQDKGRYYHTLDHLSYMSDRAHEAIGRPSDTFIFALFFHDIIYRPERTDNEFESAILARKELQSLSVPQSLIDETEGLILATRDHASQDNFNAALFIDCDLAILGAPPPAYDDYAVNVRREYAVFPDSIYKPGRRKLLSQLREREQIYNTLYFHRQLEESARSNIARELARLA